MTAERTPLAVLIGAAGEAPGILSPTQTTVQNVPTAHWWAQKKRKRTVACGKCDACCRDDCGRCLNCCDKPKFGGPGARRKFAPACARSIFESCEMEHIHAESRFRGASPQLSTRTC